MINTTHYNLQKAEANDIVNSLLPANTNMDKIDTAMFNNLNSGVHNASHTKTGTVHALVRTVTTANFFKFSATDDFRTGDTFTLDGEVITARTQAYAGLPDYAFRTGSEVIAITDHGNLFGAVDFYKTAKKHGIKPKSKFTVKKWTNDDFFDVVCL